MDDCVFEIKDKVKILGKIDGVVTMVGLQAKGYWRYYVSYVDNQGKPDTRWFDDYELEKV